MRPACIVLSAPLRSEGFVEDLIDLDPRGEAAEPPWSLRQAGLATLLCAVPLAWVALPALAGLMGLAG